MPLQARNVDAGSWDVDNEIVTRNKSIGQSYVMIQVSVTFLTHATFWSDDR